MGKESFAAQKSYAKIVARSVRLFVFFVVTLLFAAALTPQNAQAQQRSVVNPSFESNNPSGNPGFQFFANNVVPGWDSTNGTVELWDSGFNGVTSFAGAVHAEINSTAVGALYQSICFTNGERLGWSFAHRARSGAANPQTAVYEIASSSGVLIQTLATQATTLAQGWRVNSNNTGLVTYTGPTGLQRLQFRALDPGSLGNFIDDIRIFLSPYVEFRASPVSQTENFAPSLLTPNIVISGDFPSPITAVLTITGGTATLGTDYTTPTGTANFTVTIPAGSYNNQAFSSGIRLIGDRVIEGNETIIMSVGAGPGYTLASTATCGAAPNTSTTANIIDDDLNLITTKTANVSTAANGTNVTFSVQVRNSGPLVGTNISLTESLPAGMTLISATPSTGSFANPVWTIPTLASGGSATLTVVAQINANTPGNSVLVNSVTAARGDQGDPNTVGDDLTETITVPLAPAMTILKTSSPASYSTAGTALTFSIAVTNSGNVVYPNAPSISDPLVTSAGGSVICPAGPVAIGATIICTASYTVTQADVNAGRITNVASGEITLGGTLVAATDDVIVPGPAPAPAITLDKTITVGSPYAAVDQTISYNYLVTNTGNITLTEPISVSDNRIPVVSCPSIPVGGLAPNGTIACTGAYQVTQDDLNGGSVTNTATATLTQPITPVNPGDPTSVVVTSAPDQATATATQSPSLSLDKRIKVGSPTFFTAVGDTVIFEYVVRNTGNVTTTANVTIADDKIPGALICAPAGLAPNATAICEQNWTADLAALDAGSVTNTAIASTVFGGNVVNSPSDSVTVTGVQTPALSIDKSLVAPIPAVFDVNEVLNYSYLVTNTGNVTIAGPITVADNLTTVACPVVASLVPGATVTCLASYTIGVNDLAVGSTTNVATASGTFGGSTVRSPPDSVTFPVTAPPGLRIDKSSVTADFDAVGDVLSYSYLVTNSGQTGFTDDIFVDDDKAGSFLCRSSGLGAFAVGATHTCTRTYSVTQADLDRGFVTNIATARTIFAPGTGNAIAVQSPTDAVTITAVDNPELTVLKAVTAGPSPAQAGDVISYQITTTNTGNQTLQGVSVSDPLILSLACTVGGSAAPVNVVLTPGVALVCTGSYTVLQSDIDAQPDVGGAVVLENTATAQGADPQGDPVAGAGSALHPLDAANAALDTVKVIDPSPGAGDAFSVLGERVNFRVTVTNTGNITLNTVEVTDDLQPGASCTIPTLAPNASDSSCTFFYLVTQADLDAQFGTAPNTFGGFINIATATAQPANPGAPQISDDGDVFAKGPARNPSFTLEKTPVTATFSVPGAVLTYGYRVTNSGNVTLTAQPLVTDDKIGSFNCGTVPVGGLAPGGFVTCQATYTVTQADIDAGSVTNIASVASAEVPLPAVPGAAEDTATVTGARTARLSVAKLASPAGPVGLGDVITYTYTVGNTGNVTLTAVTPNDQHISAAGTTSLAIAGDALDTDAGPATGDTTDAGPNGVWDTLAPGDSVTFFVSYTVTQADVDAGNDLTNTVTVTAQSPTGTTPPVATDDANVPVEPAAASMIAIKTATVTGLSVPPAVGDVISYAISLENTGNVTISDLTLTDTLTDANGAAQALDAAPVLASGDNGDGLLQVDETWTYTANVTLTQTMIDAGGLSNTVTLGGRTPGGASLSDLSDDDGTGTSDPTVTNLDRSSAIAVVKTANLDDGGDGRADVGDTIAYSYVVSNEGNTTLFDLGLAETGFTGAGPIPTPALTAGGADLDGDADAPDLAVAATATFGASYTLSQADIDAGLVTNQGTVTADDPAGTAIDDLSGADVADDTPTDTVLAGAPTFAVVKTATDPVILFPTVQRVTFTIDVTNSGNVTQTGIQVTDDLAAFLAPATLLNATYPVATTATGFTTGSANAAYDGAAVTNLLAGNPTLLPGASGQITITLTYSTASGAPGADNIANVTSDQLTTPVPSNPVTVPGSDGDGDGVPDSLESCGPGDDRDGDGICDAQDYDPTGTFYCEEDGRILAGGNVAVTGPLGTQSGVGSSGGITIVRSGADGRFQFYVTAAGSYTLALTYPSGGVASTTRASLGSLDVTSLLPANPGSLGSGEAGLTGQLVDFSAGANTFYTTFVFEAGDPFVINNNIPLSACRIANGVIATKIADRETAVLGETITFTISFNNTTALLYANAGLIDTLPEGLVYTPGSGTLNGVATEPAQDGPRLNFGPRDVAAGEQITIRLSARVTSAARPGTRVNRALMLDQAGVQISNTATAAVLIKAESVFSCSDVIGKVFMDRNGNGIQDPDAGRAALTEDDIFLDKYGKFAAPPVAPPTGEPGLAGVRLATVNGLLISTDEFGRYHVPCAALPRKIGSNFTLKLDARSLPLGHTVTTENPRTLRLTAGKVTKMNFGVSDTAVVDIDLTADAFAKGSTVPSDALAKGIRGLVDDIKTNPSSLRLTYVLKPAEDRTSAVARLQAVEKMIRKAWRGVGRYELRIVKSVKQGQ